MQPASVAITEAASNTAATLRAVRTLRVDGQAQNERQSITATPA
jgi:hypothetical protein